MTKVLVNLDDEFVVEHLLSEQCEVMQGKPCGFSEHVMRRVVEALKKQDKHVHSFPLTDGALFPCVVCKAQPDEEPRCDGVIGVLGEPCRPDPGRHPEYCLVHRYDAKRAGKFPAAAEGRQ